MRDKSEIRKGMHMTMDAVGVGPVFPHRAAPPRTPRYGDPLDAAPDFAQRSRELEAAKLRLKKLVKDYHHARRG
jgi:hypothetical protein